MDVVGEPVQQRAGEALRTEHPGPLIEGQVGGDQDGAPLVALAEDLEEQFSPSGGQGDEAQLVDDEQAEAGHLPLQVEQPSLVPGPSGPLYLVFTGTTRQRGSPAGVLLHHGAAGPPGLPHDRGVRRDGPGQPAVLAGNSPVYGPGWKSPPFVAQVVAGKPGLFLNPAESYTFAHSSQGCSGMTLYGYARVSVREPEDKNLDLQVERLVRAGCSLGNIRAEEASGARNDRGGLLELLDLVVEGDTLVVTHIDRLSRGLTYGLQVIEGLHRAGVEFRSLSEEFDTATATGKLQLTMVLAFSEWWRNSIRERSVAGQAKARAEGRFPGRRPSLTEQQREYIRAERSKGVSQRELAKRLEVSRWTIQQADR